MPEKKLFLLDAMALIYRSYFALSRNPRISSKGVNTSAVLGFANTLLDILQKQKPTHIGVAFDLEGPTHRHTEFEAYKAQREAMPEEIVSSLPYIRELLQGFRIPVLQMQGYEADDIIGTFAKKAEKKGFITYMMTPDKDFGQLVSPNIFIFKPGKGSDDAMVLGVKEICDKYGIQNPEQFIDILGLWGDVSDNIPGVPGIGEKHASSLISKYGSIENLLTKTDELKGVIQENLIKFADQARMSRDLARIITDVPLEFDESALCYQQPDTEALKKLFDELEFKAFAERLFRFVKTPSTSPPAPERSAQPAVDLFNQPDENGIVVPLDKPRRSIQDTVHEYILVSSRNERKMLINLLESSIEFCFDTETTGLDPQNTELVGLSFSLQPGKAYFVPVSAKREETLSVLEEFRLVFEDTKIRKIGQNIKFDMAVLLGYGIKIKGKLFDTMIAHYLLEPDLRHGMDYLAETYLDYTPVPITDLIGKKGRNQITMREVDMEELKEYACEDADITFQLKELFEPKLSEFGVLKLFEEVEMPLVEVLAHMEVDGVKIDVEVLKEFSRQLGQEIIEVEQEIYNQAGVRFNIASPKQMGEVLFDKLKISGAPKLTKTKQYATSEDILAKLAHKHPVVDLILDYRSLTKLKSTYLDSLPQLLNPKTGLIHTSYNQAVASTGRLSSQNPNLQNIPIRTERGREIRKAFIPRDKGRILLAADYSQIELRIIAELADDKKMLEDFIAGRDIHTATASRVYGIPLEKVSKDMRRNAKTVNFGIIYGISAFGLSERLNIPRTEAASIIESYFREYPNIKEYMNKSILKAREKGYVETILGRRRYLRDINSANAVVRGFAERNAINAPIQGSSADMIKVAMIRIHRDMAERGLKSSMILQVHDELVFDVVIEELETMKSLVRRHMVEAIPLKVPVEVEISTGDNWLEAH